MEIFPMNLKWKILDYRMVLTLMLFFIHPHFTNMKMWNATTNNIPPWLMLQFHHKIIHQFQHWLHPVIVQEKIQYMIRSNIHIFPKTQARVVHRASDVRNKQVKLLAHKKSHPVILYFFLTIKLWKKLFHKWIYLLLFP